MTQDEYTSGFNDYNNREWMWASHVSADQSDRFGNFGAQVSRNNSTTFIRTTPIAINTTLYYSFPQSDVRLANFDPTGEHRSEEHTSELQSRGHLVCRLLLEKKNTHTNA